MDSESDDEFDIKTYSKRQNISSVSSVLKQVIQRCEKTKPQKINVITLAHQHQGNHRRLYELFNVLNYFGVTKTVGRGKLSWIGFSSMHSHFENSYFKIEEDSMTRSLQDIYVLKEIPSLGEIAEIILSLYPFLGVSTLDIKTVSHILSMKVADKKSCERKIYLALSLLETIGCVEHQPRSNSYKVLLDIKKLIDKSQKHLSDMDSVNPNNIISLLNRTCDTMLLSQRSERQRVFMNLLNVH